MKSNLPNLRRNGALVSLAVFFVLPLLGATALSPSAHAQALGAKSKTSVSPKPGSAERKRILNALRVPLVKELKQTVIFEISHIRTENGWAFLTGTPRQPNGKPINYLKTPYAEQVRESMFDDGFCALLRREKGKWKVNIYDIGATDVQWLDWGGKYGSSSAIFPHP